MEMEIQGTFLDLTIPQDWLIPTFSVHPAKSDLTHCLLTINEPNQYQLSYLIVSGLPFVNLPSRRAIFSYFILYKITKSNTKHVELL